MGESIVYAIKAGLVYAAVAVWVIAIVNVCGTVINWVGSSLGQSLVGDVFGIISMCLPFQVRTVFMSILSAVTACIGFVIARKVYSIVMKSNEAT